jgi:hypothetical protein
MRRVLLLTLISVFISLGSVFAQVFADFESTTHDFYDNGWATGFTSVSQIADPTSRTAGVLALECNAANGVKGIIEKDNVETNGAPVMGFYIYLPADFPDDGQITLWGQDNVHWAGWNATDYAGSAIPKQVWYPVYFNMKQLSIKDPGTFDPYGAAKLGKMGMQVFFGASTTWTGTVYVDDASLIGAEPKSFADFESTDDGFYDNGWATGFASVLQEADPTSASAGVLALECNAANGVKGIIQKDNIDPLGSTLMGMWVYLPADFPDDGQLTLWAQDNAHWAGWNATDYAGSAIPKQVWYPIYFNMEQLSIKDPATFYPYGTNKLGKMGLQVYFGSSTTWTGTVYVDNSAMLNTETGKKWVMADFENSVAGTQGFANTNWNPALTGLNWLADPSGKSDGVMETKWDFTKDVKGALVNGNVSFGWTEVDTGATSLTFDVWLPSDVPQTGSQLSIFVQDHNTWTWTETSFSITDTTMKLGDWNTITYDIMSHVLDGTVDPKAGASVGMQLFYSVANTWVGSIYIDNFTLIGIEKPEGEVVSPLVTAEVDTAAGFPGYYFVRLDWADSGPGTESYNVYMSDKAITDISAEGVIMIADKIPHGEQYWIHRPWTKDGAETAYHYAVLANKEDGTLTELSEDCKAGPVSLLTYPTAKAKYVADFASKFVLDGLDTEFADYAAYKLTPENAGGDDATGWTPESSDLSWSTTFVIDHDYLYISADVTDDDLNANGDQPKYSGTQPWMGDALEFFIGYYNSNLLGDWHLYNDVDKAGTGDWRIAFTAWGTAGTATSNNTVFPGVETTVYQKFTGDGYIIEARIELDSLALNHNIVVVNGARLPMQINCNDLDPDDGDTGRTLQANWGGQGGHEVWKRPSGWGFLEVIDGPDAIADETTTPLSFELFANYPNPFNPTTTVKYQVAEASDVTITVYDILGNKVCTLFNGKQQPGQHETVWNGTNEMGKPVTSGIYFCTYKAKNFSKTQKMMLIK